MALPQEVPTAIIPRAAMAMPTEFDGPTEVDKRFAMPTSGPPETPLVEKRVAMPTGGPPETPLV